MVVGYKERNFFINEEIEGERVIKWKNEKIFYLYNDNDVEVKLILFKWFIWYHLKKRGWSKGKLILLI